MKKHILAATTILILVIWISIGLIGMLLPFTLDSPIHLWWYVPCFLLYIFITVVFLSYVGDKNTNHE